MAQDRNGKPIKKDNLVRIPVRPVRPLQIEPNPNAEDADIDVLFVYPETSEVEYLTGRVLDIDEFTDGDMAHLKVDGVENTQVIATRLVEVTA